MKEFVVRVKVPKHERAEMIVSYVTMSPSPIEAASAVKKVALKSFPTLEGVVGVYPSKLRRKLHPGEICRL